MTTSLGLRVITWNVAEKGPPEDFTRLLNLDAKTLPDVYAIGLQELNTTPASMVTDAINDDPFTVAIGTQLFPRQYVRVKSVRMMGIHLSVYVRRKHLDYLCNIESEYLRTDQWGIKGGVSIRMEIKNVNICFVNCHFSAHMPKFAERLQDYYKVVEGHTFRNENCRSILEHDYVFWFGDLNFRVEQFSKSQIESFVAERDYDVLMRQDQLQRAIENELILIDFEEGPISFPPTYKYDKGTNTYDSSPKQRHPAWCDRILWSVDENAFDGIELSAHQTTYTSLMEYMKSDHKPVVADFTIQVLMYAEELAVMFEPLDTWCSSNEGKCSYTVDKDLVTSKWDWVGLYKEDFRHPKDYETYVWVSTEGSTDKQDGCWMSTIVLDKAYLRDLIGKYRLCYFSYNRNCIMGYSDVFSISLTGDSSSSSSEDEDLPPRLKNKQKTK